MNRPPWIQEAEDEAPDGLDTLLTMILIIAVVCLSVFALGAAYQLAQPVVEWIIGGGK